MHTMPEGHMAPQKSWWGRNWKWVVPVGCLTPLLACGCLGALFYFAASTAIQSSGAYLQAVSTATSDPRVQEALGTPIEPGMIQGSIKTENDEGSADFRIPLDGPKADGVLRVSGRQRGGAWTFDTLQVEVPGQAPIDLRDMLEGGTEPAPSLDDEPPPELDEGADVPADAPPEKGDSDIDL